MADNNQQLIYQKIKMVNYIEKMQTQIACVIEDSRKAGNNGFFETIALTIAAAFNQMFTTFLLETDLWRFVSNY